jgi:4-hydroxy-3-polyprenylbenzoate decarboxylase
MNDPILVAITGASGSLYGLRLAETLASPSCGREVGLIVSSSGLQVMEHEVGPRSPRDGSLPGAFFPPETRDRIAIFPADDMAVAFSSGSRRFQALVIAPASMNTVAAVAHGITLNLIHRLADVALKERRPLIMVPREAPFSVTHLENLLALARKGVIVLPASPAFYHRPRTLDDIVDFLVGRILDQLGIDHDLYRRWKRPPEKE